MSADKGRAFLDQRSLTQRAIDRYEGKLDSFTAEKLEMRKPLAWSELATRQPPERRWAMKFWLGFGHITLLVGPGGIGKTLIAQQVESALALGRNFIDDVPEALKVLAWHCEDDHDELWRRQVGISKWLDVSLDAFTDNLVIVPRHGLENALVVSEMGRVMFTPLIEELRQQAGDYKADVVVLDNVAQLFGANENDRHAVTSFMNALAGALAGKAVLLLAHPARSLGSEFSGSSAWENVARTRLYLGANLPDQQPERDEEPQDDARYLARRKANYSSKDWRRFSLKGGVLVPDVVEAMGGVVGHLNDQASERILVEGLQRLNGMNIWPTASKNSKGRYLPKVLADYKLTEGRSVKELGDAMRRLMTDGKLTIGEVAGKYANRSPMEGLRVTP